jgi:hypothetical protein
MGVLAAAGVGFAVSGGSELDSGQYVEPMGWACPLTRAEDAL